MPAASTIKSEEREFVVDSGASMHMTSKRDLNSAELETMRISKNPTTVITANGEVQTRKEATEHVKELDLFVTVVFLEETPAVLSVGKLCEDHGFSYHWTSCQKAHLTKKGQIISCSFSNCVPFVVPGITASSSSTTPSSASSSSSSQDSVFDVSRHTEIQYPKEVEVRAGNYGETRRMNPQKQKIKNKNEGCEEVQSDLLHEFLDWLQEFKANLVDESSPVEPLGNPEQGHRDTSSSSHELPMESRAKVEPCLG